MSLLAGTATIALVGAACSSDEEAAAAEAATEFIAASTPLYVEGSTDFEGAQWTQAEALLSRFPNAPPEGITDVLNDAFEDEGIDYETQVRPLLGETAVLGATPEVPTSLEGLNVSDATDSVDDTSVVAALELAEGAEDQARELLTDEADVTEVGEHEGNAIYESRDGDTFVSVVSGAIVLSDTRAGLERAIDAQRSGGDATLGGSDKFNAAVGRLPEDTFGKIYIDIGAFLEQAAAEDPDSAESLRQLGDFSQLALAASVTTEEQGIRLQGVIEGAPDGAEATAFSPTLLQDAPADAIAYVGFAGLANSVSQAVQQLRESETNEELGMQLDAVTGQLPALLGVTVDDLGALTSGEHAVVVAAPGGAPAGALALQVEDGARAEMTLDALRGATPLAGPQIGLPPDAEWSQVQLANGVQGWQIPLQDGLNAVYGVDGDLAVIGTSPQIVRQVQNPGQTLADDADFQTATQGMPDEITGLLWLDPPELLDAAERGGALDAGDQEGIDTPRTFEGIAAWTVDGDVPTFEV
ncbi:MAG: DUF3352 domain-containing protein, partial [Miltoncostaeaceae bacterium]